jgi:hypothetical protein
MVACGGNSSDTSPASGTPTQVTVVTEEAPAESAATAITMPAPTTAPESTLSQALITSPEEMAGIWLGTIAGESGYFMYTADGRYLVSLSQDALATAPRVTGEYWFEDGRIHLRDLDNAGHWAECDPEDVGIYDVVDLGESQIQFQVVEDNCGDSGFTRVYLFTNMKQKWVAEPVDAVAPASASEN